MSMSTDSPLRIALYQPYPLTFGGLQAVVLRLAAGLRERGLDPVFVCPEAGKFTEESARRGFPCRILDPGPHLRVYGRGDKTGSYLRSPLRLLALLRHWRQVAGFLRAEKFQILHCNDYRGVILGAGGGRLAGVPTLWHMHGFIPSKAANLACAGLVHLTVPVSAGMLDYLTVPRSLFGKTEVIFNGIECSQPPRTPDAPNRPVVFAAGTLHPRKGYVLLIQAMAEVIRQIPDARLQIAGGEFAEGAHGRELRTLASGLGISGSVDFLGQRSDVPELMRAAPLLVVPSTVEAFGMVAIEAMREARPVVAVRSGGLADIIVDGQTGFLTPPGDAPALATALIRLLGDATLCRTMGHAARRRVEEAFSEARMVDHFATLYRRLAAKAE